MFVSEAIVEEEHMIWAMRLRNKKKLIPSMDKRTVED